jgi:flagellar basal-body rod protein FlgB
MLERIDPSLAFQAEALKLRSQRQQLLATNIANADTPQFKAVDFDFARALSDATRAAQRNASDSSSASASTASKPVLDIQQRVGTKASLDGNSVDMDIERVQFLDNSLRYEATLRFLNGKLKTLLSAIQG